MNNLLEKRQALHQQLKFHKQQHSHLVEQSDKLQSLASVGLAWTMTAHELNNLLTPVVSYAQLALQHPGDAALAEKALQKALRMGQMATEMLQRVMMLAGQKTFQKENVSVKGLIDDVFVGIGRDFAKDKIHTTLNIPADLIIFADGPSIRQVLMNLVLNARQAMLGQPGELRIRAYGVQDAVCIDIVDTGRGMDAATMRRIFDPFFSTKADLPEAQNNGLGLSFCKRIIDSHDGSISVESEVGNGTCFKIRIPAADCGHKE